MKKILFAAIGIVCLMASCTKDELDQPAVNPNAGQEVKFTSDIDAATRTLYAEEYASSQAVKWVDGDLISVYGASCSVKQAEYKVTAATGTEDTDGDGTADTNYYYAASLTKTGAAGVQWGSEATSDFIAVYPSTANSFTPVTDGSGNFVGATVQTTVRTKQNLTFALNGDTWVGTHYAEDSSNPTMTDAVMYAYTSGATSDNVVNLKFKPFSTVLRFTFEGYQGYNSVTNGAYSEAYESTIAVTRIILTAPENQPIAGDFELSIGKDEGTVTAFASEGNSNVIELYPDYLPVENLQKIQFDVFTIPQAHQLLISDPWIVQLETTSGTFTYQMIPKKVTGTDDNGNPIYGDITPGENQTEAEVAPKLTAGAIHKVNVPLMEFLKSGFEIPAENWIRYIPRNVYISELSYPGAWYATNADYQGTATLAQMYEAGVRAFNIDCRMTASADSWEEKWAILTYYELKSNPTYLLQCAGSETLTGQKVGGIERVSSVADGLTVESQLATLSGLISDEEYIVVVLTLAEKPKDLSGALSDASETFGNNVDPANVLAALKDILTRRGEEFKVFGYREKDAQKTLNANTTVNDVLGSMIIKVNVNVDQDVTDLAGYGMSNVLLSEGSMASEAKYITTPIVAGSFTDMNIAPMYWGTTKISDPSVMNYYYHQAQLTTSSTTATSGSTTPSLYDRMEAVDKIIDQSADIYSAGTHNALFQLGIGGYIDSGSEDRTTVASTLNAHVNTTVEAKLKDEPSPIGIVLMNYCINDSYGGLTLVNNILQMNTMFYLNRNKEAEEWPNGNPFPEIDTSGTTSGSGGDLG